MSRGAYVTSFMILAFTFVPVIFSLIIFPVSLVGPCSYVAFIAIANSLVEVPKGEWAVLALDAVDVAYLALYCGIFYLFAGLTYRISNEFEKSAGKIILQILFLLAVFSCSFLRVIQGSTFVNWTGAYDFWGGCARFWQTW